jgi:hypothetical protein
MMCRQAPPVRVKTGLNGFIYVTWGEHRYVLEPEEACRLGIMLLSADPKAVRRAEKLLEGRG